MNQVGLKSLKSKWQKFSTKELAEIFQGSMDQELLNEIQAEARRRSAESLNEFSKL